MVSTGQTYWQFSTSPKDAWESMYNDCLHATKSIECEQYIFEADELGQRFIELFIRKLQEGVTVTMLCDAIGSYSLMNSALIQAYREQGGNIHFYHPVGLRHFRRVLFWFFRDHRKILVIDSAVAYTGGVCFSYIMKDWRDTHVRVTGPVVTEIQNAFCDLWNKIRHKNHLPVTKIRSYKGNFHYYTSNPRFKRNIIYDFVLDAIRNAREYIYLTTPYFIPSHYFLKCLRRAAERGVEVILLVPHHIEIPIVYHVAESYFGKALLSRIRVFKYGQQNLHSKTIIIDDRWATMGSLNLDYLSFYRNLEANLIITDPAPVMELKQHFLADLEGSRELVYDMWENRSLWQKITGYAGRLFKKFM
jgi:cardiolipin synthase A/B